MQQFIPHIKRDVLKLPKPLDSINFTGVEGPLSVVRFPTLLLVSVEYLLFLDHLVQLVSCHQCND